MPRQVDEFQRPVHHLEVLPFLAPHPRRAHHLRERADRHQAMACGQEIVAHREAAGQLRVLDGARDAPSRDLVGTQPDQFLAVEQDAAAGVGADQRQQLARGDAERDLVEHHQAAETQGMLALLPATDGAFQIGIAVAAAAQVELCTRGLLFSASALPDSSPAARLRRPAIRGK